MTAYSEVRVRIGTRPPRVLVLLGFRRPFTNELTDTPLVVPGVDADTAEEEMGDDRLAGVITDDAGVGGGRRGVGAERNGLPVAGLGDAGVDEALLEDELLDRDRE